MSATINVAGALKYEASAPPASDFVVTFTTTHQLIEGFGASSKHVNPWTTTATADLFWSPTSGIGLSLVRDGISCDGYPLIDPFAGGDEVDDTSFTALAQITAYGVIPWATIWFFPQGTSVSGVSNGSADWSDGSSALAVAHYADAANLLTTYLDRAVALGIYPRGICFQNEPDLDANQETHWSTTQSLNFVKNNLAAAFTSWGAANPTWQSATGLTKPWIMVGQPAFWSNLSTWTAAFEGDSTALAEIGYYGTHQYGGGGASSVTASKPIWQCEYYPQDGGFTQTITDGLDVAQRIHDALTIGNARAWHAWWPEKIGSGDNQGLTGDGNGTFNSTTWNAPTMTKRLFALGNWSKFVRPGWSRIDVTGSVTNVSVSAYKSANGQSYAIVMVNNTGSPITCSFGLIGTYSSNVATWVTSGTTIGALGTDGNLSQGSTSGSVPTTITLTGNNWFSATIPAGVTTFVGST